MSHNLKLQPLADALRVVADRYLTVIGDKDSYWHKRADLIESLVSDLEADPANLASHGDTLDQLAELCDVLSTQTILSPDGREFWREHVDYLRDLASAAHNERRARDHKELSKLHPANRFRLMFGQILAPNQN